MNTDIRYSQQDAAETGHGWYAVRRDRAHKLPDVSHLFRTRQEAEAWARRKGDLIRETSKPIADCPQAESPLRPVVYVQQLRFLPGMPSNDDRPTQPAMAGDAFRFEDGEPHTWSESWLFILPALVISLAAYVARAWGWL